MSNFRTAIMSVYMNQLMVDIHACRVNQQWLDSLKNIDVVKNLAEKLL